MTSSKRKQDTMVLTWGCFWQYHDSVWGSMLITYICHGMHRTASGSSQFSHVTSNQAVQSPCCHIIYKSGCRLYSNISQILMLYKAWGHYNIFDSSKSLGVWYWYVKIPHWGYMGHWLKHITFYVQKDIAALAVCQNPSLVRDKLLGAPESFKLVYFSMSSIVSNHSDIKRGDVCVLCLLRVIVHIICFFESNENETPGHHSIAEMKILHRIRDISIGK